MALSRVCGREEVNLIRGRDPLDTVPMEPTCFHNSFTLQHVMQDTAVVSGSLLSKLVCVLFGVTKPLI